MPYVLIIFMTFHFEAMPVSQQIEFSSAKTCEEARKAMVRGISRLDPDVSVSEGYGRRQLIAFCAAR